MSSLSSLKGKKSDSSWFLRVLGGDLSCKGSCQLVLFKMEMVLVSEGIMSVG